MRFLLVGIALVTLMSTPALANTNTTMVLHALDTSFGPCPLPSDPCDPGPADTQVTLGVQTFVYLILRNYTDVAGCQTAFDVPAWTFIFGLWDCQPNQVNGTTPVAPFGPTSGTIASAFDCISGGTSAPIGRMSFIPTAPG
ncbi:MAG: hypothetical protein PVF43_04480, partial [Candidatus Eiseniibacteriota bacterium]